MDVDDLEPGKVMAAPKNLEEMSIEALKDYIATLEAEIARAGEVIAAKEEARAGAHAVFKF